MESTFQVHAEFSNQLHDQRHRLRPKRQRKLLTSFIPAANEHAKKWWARQDLNLGPMDYESTALTAELRARVFYYANTISANTRSEHKIGEGVV